MRSTRLAIAAAVVTAAVLTGCSTFRDLLEGPSAAAGQPLSNLLRNPSFESFKPSSRGVASDWVVREGYTTLETSLSKDAFRGDVAQRIDVLAIEPGREDPWVGITQSPWKPRLKGNAQYEISAWVKGRGTAALSVILNDDASATLGAKVVLDDAWQYLQMSFATPNRVRNIRELVRFGDGGLAEGDWLQIDGVSLLASASRLGSLLPQAITSIAERKAIGASTGAKVIAAAVALVKNGTVVKGGCWDWVNRAYNDAGFTAKKRRTVFQSKPEGPYVNHALIRGGDWISFSNLTYGEIGHSAIFVDWLDFERHSALTVEYAGENREIPGRYREYDIFKCYIVVRPAE
jgi:hypothetical protein